MKHGQTTKKQLVKLLFDETIWAMRWISSVGTTTPVISGWGFLQRCLQPLSGLLQWTMAARSPWKRSSAIKGYAKKAAQQAAIYKRQLRRCKV